jgi:pilus assembly protein FimV
MSQPGAATGGGAVDRDLDWLTGIGDDLGSLDDAGETEDDFSSLISGEDEVGTKLDLAKAYMDMGDQESARNILSEVAQEGSQDQQREANELMRQIG